VGGKLSPSPLYKEPLGGEFDTSGLREFLGRALLSSSCAFPLPSLPCGSPKGCVGLRSSPSLHATVLREFRIRSKTDLLPQSRLDRRDRKKVIVHHMCTSTRRCCTCGAGLLSQWCRGVEIFTTLRSAMSASSSTPVWRRNPRVRSTRVRHRISC
jgi:hypothetical protein